MKVPLRFSDQRRHIEKIALAVNTNDDGKTGTVTFTASVTTTTVLDSRVGNSSFISLMPTTANAAAENWYIGTITAGTSFVITHANAATVDRTFTYTIIGN